MHEMMRVPALVYLHQFVCFFYSFPFFNLHLVYLVNDPASSLGLPFGVGQWNRITGHS